jgi:CHAT domain-containing protein/Tfp pilus assembly protein PilF
VAFKKPLHLTMYFIIHLYLLSNLTIQGLGNIQDNSTVDRFAQILMASTKEEQHKLLLDKKDLVNIDLRKALIAIGDRFKSQANYLQSLNAYQLAQKIAEELKDSAGYAEVLLNIGHVHYAMGNYTLALDSYRKSLIEYEKLKDKNGIASAANNIGNSYMRQNNHEQALIYLQKGLNLRKEMNDKVGIANSLSNIGNYYNTKGNYEEALKYHLQSLKLREDLKDHTWIAISANNIGVIFSLQGNYAKALEYYNRSLNIRRNLNNRIAIINILTNIGAVHRLQGNYEIAFKYLKESLTINEELGNRPALPVTLNNMGNIYTDQEMFKDALDYYTRSLKLSEELDNRFLLAHTLVNIGNIHSKQTNYKQALDYYNKSLAIREKLEDRAGIAETLHFIGVVHEKDGQLQLALEFSRRAADIAKEVNNRYTLWESLAIIGKVYRALKETDKARQALEEAISVVESMRMEVGGGEQAQQRFFENKLLPYHELIDLYISEKNYDQALFYIERAKARVLSEVLQKGRINLSKAMTTEEREQEHRLYAQIVSINNRIQGESSNKQPNTKLLNELKSQLEQARLEYSSFQNNLYIAHPELRVHRGEAQILKIEELSNLIDTKTAIIEFVSTESTTYLFVITKASNNKESIDIKVFPINIKRKELVEHVKSFRERLATVNLNFRKHASDIYDLLLKPADAQLQDKTNLIIVPDQILWELPFQALVNSKNHYLLEESSISYVPSLTVLKEMVKRKASILSKSPNSSLLAFGNPDLGIPSDPSSTLGNVNLKSLPEAEKQVKMIADIYGSKDSKIYIGADATEEKVKADASNYRILHFATHGILNDTSPLYSYILLSQTKKSEKEDGLFEAWELMRLELNADLIVLSACETARGRIGAGEGVIGLTWALFVAGCPTTVVSQWKVESASTTHLMVEFHNQLRGGNKSINKAEALRQASLKLLKNDQYKHPFYWASFVIVGAT